MTEKETDSITIDDLIVQIGERFGLAGAEELSYGSRDEARAAAESVFLRPMEAAAPQFCVKRGAELGYHCHVYKTIKNKDVGIVLTMEGDNIFAQTHRNGKVKKPVDINSIGQSEKDFLTYCGGHELHSIPGWARRKPCKNAVLIGNYREVVKTKGTF